MSDTYESQRHLAWTRIFNEGHTLVARLKDTDAETPLRPWLRLVPVLLAGIVIAWTVGGGTLTAASAKVVDWSVTKIAGIGASSERPDPQRDGRIVADAISTMFAGSADNEALPLTHENVKDVLADQIKAASGLSTTWKGAGIADDAMEVIRGGDHRWLFAKIATPAGPRPLVVVLRKHDGEYKPYAIDIRGRSHAVPGMPVLDISLIPLAVEQLAAEISRVQGAAK